MFSSEKQLFHSINIFENMLLSMIFHDLKSCHCQESPKCFHFSNSGFLMEKLEKNHQHGQQKSLIPRGGKIPISSGFSLGTTLQIGPKNNFPSYLLTSVARKTFPLVRAAEQASSYILTKGSNGYTTQHEAGAMTRCPMSRSVFF